MVKILGRDIKGIKKAVGQVRFWETAHGMQSAVPYFNLHTNDVDITLKSPGDTVTLRPGVVYIDASSIKDCKIHIQTHLATLDETGLDIDTYTTKVNKDSYNFDQDVYDIYLKHLKQLDV